MEDNHSPSTQSRAWLWVILGLGIFIVLLLGVFSLVYFHDNSPPNDADLRVRDAVVPAEQNGLVQLRKLPGGLDFGYYAESQGVDEVEATKILNGASTNDQVVDKFLAQAQPNLEQLDAVLQLPYFSDNDVSSPTTRLPEIGLGISYAKALRLSASRHQALGDYTAAVQDAARIHLLARRLVEGHKSLLQVLTAVAIDGIGRMAAQKLLDDSALPAASSAALAQEYSREISWTGGLQRSLNYEYLLLLNYLNMIKTGRTTPATLLGTTSTGIPFMNLSIRENETKQAAVDYYRDLRQALNKPYSVSNGMAFANIKNYIGDNKEVKYWLRPNLAGRSMLGVLIPNIDSIAVTMYTATAVDRLLQTECTLRLYFDDHHALPPTLNDLVPAYLPDVPLDPFNGKPLRYDAARGIIYSVGTSLKDLGGSSRITTSPHGSGDEDPLNDRSQPTLQLEFQNPPVMKTPTVTTH